MSNKDYNSKILTIINNFRKSPVSQQKGMITMSKALKRGKQENIGKELEENANKLNQYTGFEVLKDSVGLQKAAEDQLLNIIKGKSKLGIMTDMKLKERCNYFTTSNDGAIELADQGDFENIVNRLFISEFDPNRHFKDALLNENYKHIGIASSDFGDEPVTVIIVATNVVEEEQIDYGEDKDLKDAFDLFDVYHTGKLEIKAIQAAFEALGFDKDSYSVYKAIVSMEKQKNKDNGVEWPEFRDTIKALVGNFDSKEGLRTLFELFVDSPDQDKITVSTMKRVAKELEDQITYKDLVDVMKRSAANGIDIDFEEFYQIMQNYKELHPEIEEK